MSKQERDKSENPPELPYPNLEAFTLNDFRLVSPLNDKPYAIIYVRPDAAEYISRLNQGLSFLGDVGATELTTEEALSRREHLVEKDGRFLDWVIRETAERLGVSEEEEIRLRAEYAETLSFVPFPDAQSVSETKQRTRRKAAEDYLSEVGIIMTVKGIIGLGFSIVLQKEDRMLHSNPDLGKISHLIHGYMDEHPRFVIIDESSGEEIFKIPWDLMSKEQSTS